MLVQQEKSRSLLKIYPAWDQIFCSISLSDKIYINAKCFYTEAETFLYEKGH